jgi:hypothetical protein
MSKLLAAKQAQSGHPVRGARVAWRGMRPLLVTRLRLLTTAVVRISLLVLLAELVEGGSHLGDMLGAEASEVSSQIRVRRGVWEGRRDPRGQGPAAIEDQKNHNSDKLLYSVRHGTSL